MTGAAEPAGELRSRPAQADDLPLLLELMRAFYAEDRIAFDPSRVSRGLRQLLADPGCGQALLWLDQHGQVAGYAVLAMNFSLEQGGWHALLDEVYLAPSARGRGWGRQALAAAERWARGRGLARLRLEVNRHNAAARRLYLSAGFADERRDLLTLDLGDVPA